MFTEAPQQCVSLVVLRGATGNKKLRARVFVTKCAQSDLLHYNSIGVSSAQLNIRLQKQEC